MTRKNPKNHSATSLNNFAEKCERCSAFDALMPQPKSPAMAKGSQVHTALERIALHMKAGHTANEARDIVLEAPPSGPYNATVMENYIRRGASILRHVEPLRVEQWFEKDGRYPNLVGKIDLVSSVTPIVDSNRNVVDTRDGKCIIDHKTTSSSAYIKGEAEARLSLQTLIYALVEDCPTVGYFWFLPSGKPQATIVELSDREMAIADRTIKDLMRAVDARWNEAWDRVHGSDCKVLADDRLVVKGFDLSIFAPGIPSRPFINTKHSRHAELCLGLES